MAFTLTSSAAAAMPVAAAPARRMPVARRAASAPARKVACKVRSPAFPSRRSVPSDQP